MANYTMTVYEILEQKELYPNGILPKEYAFYTEDPVLRKEFEDLFIAHYMTSEIGFETVYRFQKAFQAKMMLITPLMKQRWNLYLEWEKDLDYLYDTNNYTDTRTIDTTDNGTSNTTTNDSGTNSSSSTNEGTNNTTNSNSGSSNTINKGSDTNNGVALIDATEGALTSESTSNVNTSDSGNSSNTFNNGSESNGTFSNSGTSNTTSSNTGKTEEVFNHTEKRTSLMYPSADLVVKRRDLLFDLNREIINQTRDLFMTIY